MTRIRHTKRRFEKAAALAISLMLAACTTAQLPPAGTPVITVASGSFYGSTSTQIFADGTLIGMNASPGKPPVQTVQQGAPDAYTRAAAVLAAEGAATQAALKPHPDQCLDYGTDQVSAEPPVAGIGQITTACSDAAMTRLMEHVLSSLVAK